MDFLADKICMSLNDSFKIHPAITPIAFMHHQTYSREGNTAEAPLHPHFDGIRYPVVKGTGKTRAEDVDWDNPYYYYFDWNHEIERIYEMSKHTDHLYYTPEGCSLHAALQLGWIMGAKTLYTIGCDSTTLGGRHYAQYDKNKFRDDEVLKRGQTRNYDSYVKGTLIVQDFLRRKGVRVLNLSPIVGYHMVDYQYEVLRGEIDIRDVIAEFAAPSPEPQSQPKSQEESVAP
jgi:hypothetical protein